MRNKNIIIAAIVLFVLGAGAFAYTQPDAARDLFKSKELYKARVAEAMTTPAADAATAPAEATTEATTAEPAPATAAAATEPAATTAEVATETTATPVTNSTALNNTPTAAGEAAPAPVPAATDAAASPSAPAADATAAQADPLAGLDIAAVLQDYAIGSPDAKLTVYDYSSLTCPHCANFHNTILPKVKQYYIDTGKVRWVFRTFPHNEPALRADMLARCMGRDGYLKMIDMLFENQERWAFTSTPIPSLAMLVRVGGVDNAKFEACTTNKQLEEGILKIAQEGTDKYKIGSTPTFVFNDGARVLAGAGTYEGFAYELDTALEGLGDTAKAATQSTPAPAGKL